MSEEPSNHDNLTPSQCELLLHHCQFGHLHMTRVQTLAKEGLFGSNNKDITNCDPPLCKACVHGKQHCHPINPPTTELLDASNL